MGGHVIVVESDGTPQLPFSSLPVPIQKQVYDRPIGMSLCKVVVQRERFISRLPC